MGTVGSLASSAGRGDSLRSTADLGAGVPAEGVESHGPEEALLFQEMTKAQVCVWLWCSGDDPLLWVRAIIAH